MSVYVGNVPTVDIVPDDKMLELFESIGPIARWGRQKDPSDDSYSSFGFVEFTEPFDVLCALRWLNHVDVTPPCEESLKEDVTKLVEGVDYPVGGYGGQGVPKVVDQHDVLGIGAPSFVSAGTGANTSVLNGPNSTSSGEVMLPGLRVSAVNKVREFCESQQRDAMRLKLIELREDKVKKGEAVEALKLTDEVSATEEKQFNDAKEAIRCKIHEIRKFISSRSAPVGPNISEPSGPTDGPLDAPPARPFKSANVRFAEKIRAQELKKKQRELASNDKKLLSRSFESTNAEKERKYRLRAFSKHRDMAYENHYLPDMMQWLPGAWTDLDCRLQCFETVGNSACGSISEPTCIWPGICSSGISGLAAGEALKKLVDVSCESRAGIMELSRHPTQEQLHKHKGLLDALDEQSALIWQSIVPKLEQETRFLQDKTLYKSKELEEVVSEQDEPDLELRSAILNHDLVVHAKDKLMRVRKALVEKEPEARRSEDRLSSVKLHDAPLVYVGDPRYRFFEIALSDVKSEMRELAKTNDFTMSVRGALDSIGPEATVRDLPYHQRWDSLSSLYECVGQYQNRKKMPALEDTPLPALVFDRFEQLLKRFRGYDVAQNGGVQWWIDAKQGHGRKGMVVFDHEEPSRSQLDRRWLRVGNFISTTEASIKLYHLDMSRLLAVTKLIYEQESVLSTFKSITTDHTYAEASYQKALRDARMEVVKERNRWDKAFVRRGPSDRSVDRKRLFDRGEDGYDTDQKRPKRDMVRPDFAYDPTNRLEDEKRVLMKKNITLECMRSIPSSDKSLFEFPIEWDILHEAKIIDKDVRQWLRKKTVELIGGDDETVLDSFTSIVMMEFEHVKPSPYKLIDEIADVLDDEARGFVVRLWKMIVLSSLVRKREIDEGLV
eukprot:GHVH01004819.1.p1 GENE.GHVH01004819.1~~GHVH01004819.1.p1  ORF type:complete len:942 (+),score=134.02 GHVH01004819.1:148-2826(+)